MVGLLLLLPPTGRVKGGLPLTFNETSPLFLGAFPKIILPEG